MRRQTTQSIDELLDRAERERRCAFSHNASTRKTLQRRQAKGKLLSPAHGLYVREKYWTGLEAQDKALHVIRAMSRLHPEWVFSRFSAALVQGLWVSKNLCFPVHINSSFERRFTAVAHHQTCSAEFTIVDGIRVTPLAETIFDCARGTDFCNALPIADSGLVALESGRAELCGYIRQRFKGFKGIKRALAVIAHADKRSESAGESFARARIIELGFQTPDLQRSIANPLNPSQTYRVDFIWDLSDGRKIAGEFDGMVKYADARYRGNRTTERVLIDERERESCLNAAGISVMRFKYRDVLDSAYFERLLTTFGIPKSGTPLLLSQGANR